MTDGALYVYGVTSATARTGAEVTGVQEAKVGAVVHRGLAALVSPVSGHALGAAREVRAHWRVLDEASKSATVLPVRFGTVMESADAVRERLLEPSSGRLESLLNRLAGCVQLTVKGDYDEPVLMREIVQSSRDVAALRERVRSKPAAAGYYDRIQLGEMVAAEVDRRRSEDMRMARGALERLAVAAKEEKVGHPNMAFNLAFLVQRDGEPRFSEQVAKLADDLGDRIKLRYIGPLPPYSFADAELAEEEPSWA